MTDAFCFSFRPAAVRAACIAACALAHGSSAQTAVTFFPPTLDSWVYDQGAGPVSPYAPTFSSPLNGPDPDRLGSLGLVFETTQLVDPAQGPWVIESATLFISLINSSNFDPTDGVVYDPTYDSFNTYPPLGTQPDEDPGRPVELYGAMPDPGTTIADFVAAGGPVAGTDGPYAIEPFDFDDLNQPRLVTNNVDDGFDTHPFAVGQALTTYVGPDSTLRIADESDMVFEIDVTDPQIQAWLSQSLDDGYVGLMVSSLHGAFREGEGGIGEVYPRWATDETFGIFPAQLDLVVSQAPACVADVNTTNTNPGDPGYGAPDGSVDGADLSYFVEQWLGANAAVADVNTTNTNPGDLGYGQPDGSVDGADLSFFVENWLGGCAS